MFFDSDFRQLGKLNIEQLKSKISCFNEIDWCEDQTRQESYIVHQQTQTINLIFNDDLRHENPTICPRYNELSDLLVPIKKLLDDYFYRSVKIKRLRRHYGEPYFIRMIIVRLCKNGVIQPHRDNGYSLERCHRIHVPIETTDRTCFTVGDSDLNMNEGEVWEINNRNIHSVENNSLQWRVHLIIDYVIPGEKIFENNEILTA